jgi:hypothetical protein
MREFHIIAPNGGDTRDQDRITVARRALITLPLARIAEQHQNTG